MTEQLPKFNDYAPPVPAQSPQNRSDGWQRLHVRMIWVDAIQSVLSLTPAALAIWVFGVEPSLGSMWPVIAVAVFGLAGAIGDAVRWVFTRYRVTPDYVERRTGLLVRSYRSVRRDRIRSVDSTAKLRHRLAGLRVVEIGAGQQTAANESAFSLDAISKAEAEALRHELLWGRKQQSDPAQAVARPAGAPTADSEIILSPDPAEQVFARLRPSWVIFNMFNIWAYLLAAGLLWGGYWLATTFGLDVADFVQGAADWEALGWGWTIAIGVAVTGAIGVVGMAVVFFTENWNFELARVPGEKGTLLRTRQGLFKTREINRDDNRLRGVEIAEPLLWRWMGMADTTIITTGLDGSVMSSATTIVPRGPVDVARVVAASILNKTPNPLETPLERHPRAALRRRLVWASLTVAGVAGVLVWLAATDVVPWWSVAFAAAFLPIALWGAWVAYRALGHAISGEYLVVRSGLLSRSTAALQRKSVSTVAIRESVLQRRLGLKTVAAMTAAGWGIYEAADLRAGEAVPFALDAAPGLLEPFLVRD
ncbi:PH domain-containing protein [Phytoactinopolyspora mesophila]|uniref:PH domain-containing protein n=1 Tax=Phytoactinopolyspora mesophila TaxID=2650750 RepID=A0A7K3M6L9_9ACTN|nr:PH domain-containing protein [Phytoactinopolyspora mesophila]NDL58963.1 PH domain-containing protein [Phytoactinopolyspora mesophila]